MTMPPPVDPGARDRVVRLFGMIAAVDLTLGLGLRVLGVVHDDRALQAVGLLMALGGAAVALYALRRGNRPIEL
jgi:hypothetical protein